MDIPRLEKMRMLCCRKDIRRIQMRKAWYLEKLEKTEGAKNRIR